MKTISFNEFAQLCNDKRVICEKTGLRADFNFALEKTLGEFATKKIYIGGDNDRESYEITEHTYDYLSMSDDKSFVVGGIRVGGEFKYSITNW